MLTLEELLAQCEDLSTLTDDELAELLTNLREAGEGLLDGTPTDTDLEQAEQVATAIDSITTAQDTRETEATERAARAAALAERISGEAEDADGDDDAEGDGETEGEGDDAEGGDAGEATETEGEPEAIAASATPPAPANGGQRRAARTNARRPAAVQPRNNRMTPAGLSLVASANVPGITAGSPLDSPEDLAEAFGSAFRASAGYHGPRVKIPVARIGQDAAELYSEDRYLSHDFAANERKIRAVTSRDALRASGGICAPTPVQYDLPIVGTDARPFRDQMMVRFGADRGGVRTMPPPQIDELDGAVSIWTEANDIALNAPATKPCLTVTCPEDDETVVDAIVKCLEFGNFRARYFPEQITAWMNLAATRHAREAEVKLMTDVSAGSTAVTTGQVLGTTRDVLAGLDRAGAAIRSFHRLPSNFPLRWGFPFWLMDQIRTDLARELPGSTDERLATADAKIDTFFAVRNVNPTPLLDGESGQIFNRQGDGPLQGWPSTAVTYLYPEGSWLFLDGGTLDLGLVRDSTLNRTNDFQMFSETFEAAHFHGVESWRLTFDTCPDGSTSSTVDIDPCVVGS